MNPFAIRSRAEALRRLCEFDAVFYAYRPSSETDDSEDFIFISIDDRRKKVTTWVVIRPNRPAQVIRRSGTPRGNGITITNGYSLEGSPR